MFLPASSFLLSFLCFSMQSLVQSHSFSDFWELHRRLHSQTKFFKGFFVASMCLFITAQMRKKNCSKKVSGYSNPMQLQIVSKKFSLTVKVL